MLAIVTVCNRFLITLPLVTIAIVAAACSSDSGTDDPETSGSGQFEVPHIDAGPIPEPFSYADVEDPWPEETAAACKAYTPPENTTEPYPEYRACACDTCLEWMHQCDAIQSCREIRECGLDKGCTTPNACYLAPVPNARDPEGAGCVEVIDKWGNTGLGTYLSRRLADCTTSCPRPQ
jgi:hypothetical protein